VTQYYAYRRFRLDRAPTNTRILITCFYVMILIAVTVGVVNYKVRTGLTPVGTEQYYRGNEGVENATEMRFEKTTLELLDVTHPHLFEQTIFMFVLCHLFGLTKVRERRKRWVYIAAFGSVLLDASMPWLVTFVSPAFAPVHVVSSILLASMFLILMGRPFHEMWFGYDKEEHYDWVQG